MATYYVDGAVGNDGNSGTSEGAGNAWLTIQKALDTVAAGDKVWVKASATYNEALTTSTAGTAAAPIVMEGYATDLGDEGVPTNDGTAGALARGWIPIGGVNFYVWKNFHFTNFTDTGFGSLTGDDIQLYRIRASNCGDSGVDLDDRCEVTSCHFHDNTQAGILVGSFGTIHNSIAANNGFYGFYSQAGMTIVGCLAYKNTGVGIFWVGAGAYGVFLHNTIVASAASGATGMDLSPAQLTNRFICANNTVSGYSGGGGKGIHTPSMGERAFVFNNNVYNCETAYVNCSDLGGGTTSDPSFVGAGSDDYTPDTGSPLIANGLDLTDVPGAPTLTTQTRTVGALLRATVADGGLLIHPGTSGGARG